MKIDLHEDGLFEEHEDQQAPREGHPAASAHGVFTIGTEDDLPHQREGEGLLPDHAPLPNRLMPDMTPAAVPSDDHADAEFIDISLGSTNGHADPVESRKNLAPNPAASETDDDGDSVGSDSGEDYGESDEDDGNGRHSSLAANKRHPVPRPLEPPPGQMRSNRLF